MPEAERAATLDPVRALVAAGEIPDELPVHVVVGLTARA